MNKIKNDTRITIRLPADLRSKIELIANFENKSASEKIKALIKKEVNSFYGKRSKFNM